MGKTEITKEPSRPFSPHFYAVFAQVHNTLYLDEAVRHLREEGEEATDEDLARVSPLAREHVRVLGRYHFTLDESVTGGSLRPLRDPEELDEYELPVGESGELWP